MDLNAIKARLAQLTTKTKKSNGQWKPKDEHDVRILPRQDSDDPFVEIKMHYDVDPNGKLLCPKTYGPDEQCDFCDWATELYAWKNPDGSEKSKSQKQQDWEIFRRVQSKSQFAAPMCERRDDGSVSESQWWATSYKVYTDLLTICADPDCNADRDDGGGVQVLTSVDNGYDIHVSFKKSGEKGNGTTMPQTTVKERKKPSKLAAKKDAVQKILAGIPDWREIWPKPDATDVRRIYKKFTSEGAPAPEDKKGGDPVGTEKYAANTTEKKLAGGRSLDEAFDDMANDPQA